MPSTRQDARYRDIRLLGSGGMATVTLAEDTKLGRLAALKRVHGTGDPRGLTRLRREALVGASLNHPNLVSVYDVLIEDDGDLTIVMQYVAGNTLRDVIRGGGIRPAREALRILEGVASGLDAIHARGIVHRDVKPANVLLGTDGTVKLADLGIAAVAERTQITTAGAVVGTFSYMAPEQLDGRPSAPPVDIYALSAVAYEMLVGQKARPEPNPLALAHAISTRPPPDLRDQWPQAPADAAAVLQRGMAFDPAERPRSAGDLVRRLGAALIPRNTAAMRTLPRQEPPAPVRAPVARRPPPAARPGIAARPNPAYVHRGGRRDRRAGVLLALLAAVVAAGALIADLGTGGGTPGSRAAGSRGGSARAHRAGATSRVRRTSSTAAKSAASAGGASKSEGTAASSAGQASAPSGLPGPVTADASPPGTGATAGAATPTGAVQSFYELAAHHDYAGAWQLADSNLRNQLAGFPSFQSQMSAVRWISFHEAQMLPGAGGSAAAVAVRTTAQLADRTQQCAGTVRTVRSSSGGAWLLDGLSISCSP